MISVWPAQICSFQRETEREDSSEIGGAGGRATLFAEALAKNGLESKMDTYYEAEKADLPEWTSRAAS